MLFLLNINGRKHNNLALTMYCFYWRLRKDNKVSWLQQYILLPQKEGSKATWLQHCITISTESCWKGAKWPGFNTVAPLLQNVVGREQSDLTSTLYTATTEGREQSDLTSILYTATTNTVPHYHRKLMEGRKATWLQHNLNSFRISRGVWIGRRPRMNISLNPMGDRCGSDGIT